MRSSQDKTTSRVPVDPLNGLIGHTGSVCHRIATEWVGLSGLKRFREGIIRRLWWLGYCKMDAGCHRTMRQGRKNSTQVGPPRGVPVPNEPRFLAP